MKIKILYNNKILRDRRRELRRNQTEPEKALWRELSNRQVKGLKFYRQYSVGPYILDFYCPKIRLAIELDGKTHDSVDAKVYDKERTDFLKSLNIAEIRFKNEEVSGVVTDIIDRYGTK